MGSFCSTSICDVDRGDDTYKKITHRNMDKKAPSITPDMYEEKSREKEIPMTPITPEMDAPNATYTHTTLSSSSSTITSKRSNSISHMTIPTPSIQEIQHAMDNLHLWASSSQRNVFSEEKEAITTLPTMAAFDVSNLVLANPFASPQNSINPNNINPIHESRISIPQILPNTLVNSTSNQSNQSTTNIHNINIITSVTNPEIVLQAIGGMSDATAMQSDVAMAAPANNSVSSIFGGDNNTGTMVVHGDEQLKELTLQQEGSSDQKDETNTVFSPPTISDPPLKAIHDDMDSSETIKVIDDTDENVQNMNDNQTETVPMEAIAEQKTQILPVQTQHSKLKHVKSVKFNDTIVNERDSVQRGKLNENDAALEQSDGGDTTEIETDSDLEEDMIEQNRCNDKNNKHRKSNEINMGIPQNMRLELYDNTTIGTTDDESETESETNDESEKKKPTHSTLFRENSKWKWQKKEVKEHQKMIEAEIKKLQIEQEIAEMNKAMTYYRTQSTNPY